MKKVIALLAASLVVLAACGNDDEATNKTEQTAEFASENVASTDEQTTTEATEEDTSTAEQTASTDSEETEQSVQQEAQKTEAKTSDTTATASAVKKGNLAKPTTLKESSKDNSFVIYDANADNFVTKRIDYSYKEQGSQVTVILTTLYAEFYKSYFNGHKITKDESKIIVDLKKSGLTKNNFAASNENYVEIITSLFVNFPQVKTIQFQVNGQNTELDSFTTTSRTDWKMMMEQNGYTFDVIED